jgi:hypothetical protein
MIDILVPMIVVVMIIVMSPMVSMSVMMMVAIVVRNWPHLEILVLLLHELPKSGFGRTSNRFAESNTINHLFVVWWFLILLTGKRSEVLENEIGSWEILDLTNMKFVEVLNTVG